MITESFRHKPCDRKTTDTGKTQIKKNNNKEINGVFNNMKCTYSYQVIKTKDEII